jgi:hypothetical protein
MQLFRHDRSGDDWHRVYFLQISPQDLFASIAAAIGIGVSITVATAAALFFIVSLGTNDLAYQAFFLAMNALAFCYNFFAPSDKKIDLGWLPYPFLPFS